MQILSQIGRGTERIHAIRLMESGCELHVLLYYFRAYLLLDLARISLDLNLPQIVALCVEQMRNTCIIKVRPVSSRYRLH